MTKRSTASNIGANLKRMRSERGLEAQELARLAGVNPTWLSRIENGRGTPNLASLRRLAAALKASVGEIMGERHG